MAQPIPGSLVLAIMRIRHGSQEKLKLFSISAVEARPLLFAGDLFTIEVDEKIFPYILRRSAEFVQRVGVAVPDSTCIQNCPGRVLVTNDAQNTDATHSKVSTTNLRSSSTQAQYLGTKSLALWLVSG
jgi:hypothetical protein